MPVPSPRRSLRLRHNTLQALAGKVVFEVPELLAKIVDHCSWASRVRLSHTAVHARAVVQASIRQRIRGVLKPFIQDLSTFFELIREIKAAITGSVAWNVMTADTIAPRDVNIVVPNGSAYGVERLKDVLSRSGTTVTFDGPPGLVYEKCASRFIRLMQKSVSLAAATQPSIVHGLCRARR